MISTSFRCASLFGPLSALLAVACGTRPPPAATSVPSPAVRPQSKVEIVRGAQGFALLRNGEPYYVRGVGGHQRLDEAKALGANSIRTWGTEQAPEAFAAAERHAMTVFAGIWLSHDAKDYQSDPYKAEKRKEVESVVTRYKDHPALLAWAIGNEIQLNANVPEAWKFVEELAKLVRKLDPNHPIATVTAHAPTDVLNNIAEYAPSINLLGVNSYAGLPVVPRDMDASKYQGPYLVTEWGPNGHWEVGNTSWGRPIEQSSAEKAAAYAERYELIRARSERCLGSYAFFWGQKQERTPTWYGVFVEKRPELGLNGERTAVYDVLGHAWSGKWPEPRAPEIDGLILAGKRAADSVTVKPGTPLQATVETRDPRASSFRYVWEVLDEPVQLGSGGSWEARPASVDAELKVQGPQATFVAPRSGEYRLFVYVLDEQGKVGTANFPFRVVEL